MIDAKDIEKAAEYLNRAAPEATIILFGSYARGDAHEGSDLDFLVVEPVVTARRMEMVRLSDTIRPLRIPADIVVVSKKSFDEWRDVSGTIIHAAAREGRVLYEAA